MMKKSVVIGPGSVLCPCCGYHLTVGATIRLKGEPRDMSDLDDYANEAAAERKAAVEEAERHG